MTLLQPYLPQVGGQTGSAYSEAGALYALGLIHANKGIVYTVYNYCILIYMLLTLLIYSEQYRNILCTVSHSLPHYNVYKLHKLRTLICIIFSYTLYSCLLYIHYTIYYPINRRSRRLHGYLLPIRRPPERRHQRHSAARRMLRYCIYTLLHTCIIYSTYTIFLLQLS